MRIVIAEDMALMRAGLAEGTRLKMITRLSNPGRAKAAGNKPMTWFGYASLTSR